MASSFSTASSLSPPPQTQSNTNGSMPARRHQVKVQPASATASDNTLEQQPPPKSEPKLPVREIPGGYGIPFISPIMDRLDYYYNQGIDGYFNTRMEKYKSTVFRANMPPGPFISSNSKCVVILDGKSFPVLFDVTKVEKKDLFTGTYMPSTKLTGGYRVLSYLDPSEPKHALLKNLLFFMLKSRHQNVIPEFHGTYTDMFRTLENDIATKGKVDFNKANEQASFSFLVRAFYGVNPTTTKLGTEGPKLANFWLLFQLHPIFVIGALPKYLEDLLLHTFPLPPFLIQKSYQRLYNFFNESGTAVLDEAVKMGIPRDEACHNLVFATCFNSFGGLKVLFPSLLKWIGLAGTGLHARIREEIRNAVRSNGGVTMAAVEQMPLMKSVVYETLRIEPPVPFQYGKAKRDLVVESHDAAFNVKKGEMIFGYQPFATNDPRIFENPDEFVADRFVGEGEKLLKHVMWSNAPETETPSAGNKQCAGKDFVVFSARLFVVEFFLHYDTFKFEIGKAPVGSSVTLTSLTKFTS